MKNKNTSVLPGQRRGYQGCKRVLDIVLSTLALVLLSPIMLLIMLLLRISDGGPALYSQRRLGRNGNPIRVWKFRSMCPGADESLESLTPEQQAQYRAEYKIDHDPRVTPIGAFLRRTSLDELPQLWNVLKGDMSLVGPRPVLPDEIGKYTQEEQRIFLSILPGLTGLWQACAGPEDTYTTGKRQQMELEYARNASFAMDLWLMARTVSAVIRKALHG